MKKTLLPILFAGAVLTTALNANAVPAKRGLFEITQPDGTTMMVQKVGDEFFHMTLNADGEPLIEDADGFLRVATQEEVAQMRSRAAKSPLMLRKAAETATEESDYSGIGLFSHNFPHFGEPKAIVILVSYQDVDFSIKDPYTYFYNMLNQEGFDQYNGAGSARDWFIDNSNGQFKPQFDVYGPVTLPRDREYYGQNDVYGSDKNPWDMVLHAAQLLDDEIDFSEYDTDGDGVVDNIFLYYAGVGEASSRVENAVWPHSHKLSYLYSRTTRTFDGVEIDCYGCSNELVDSKPDGIGTFVHEFSHVMGLPDLYCTTYSSATNLTPGYWDVLDYGAYNGDGRVPPSYSAFARNALEWVTPIVIDQTMEGTLEDIQSSNACYLIPTDKDDEFFLLENRQQTSWDQHVPGHGMLIWHIDYDRTVWEYNSVNNDYNHQYIDIEEAGGRANNSSSMTMASYPFPGTSGKTEFGHKTTPSMATWAGTDLGITISDIAESEDGIITFHAEVTKKDTEGISDIKANVSEDATYYNLQGVRVNDPAHGIYIRVQNGKAEKIALN